MVIPIRAAVEMEVVANKLFACIGRVRPHIFQSPVAISFNSFPRVAASHAVSSKVCSEIAGLAFDDGRDLEVKSARIKKSV